MTSFPINDIKKMIMEYIPKQCGSLATINKEWKVSAEEDGMKLWRQIEQIPNVAFIAKHSAAIQNATTAKGKMKALGAVLYHTTWARLPRWNLQNLGDHSALLNGFKELSDAMRSEQLLSTAISRRDFTLFEAIDLKMFSPESIEGTLATTLDPDKMDYLAKLIPHAPPDALSRMLTRAVEGSRRGAAEQILASKKRFSVDLALKAAAASQPAYIPLICESGKPFSTTYYPLRDDFYRGENSSKAAGLQDALFAAVDANTMSGIEALLAHFSPSLDMLKHVRDRARLVHIYHLVNDNPPFAGRAADVFRTLYSSSGNLLQREAIRAALPRRYTEDRERLPNLVCETPRGDHDLWPMIERLNREIATRFPGEPPEPQPTLAEYQPDPVDRSDGHLGRMMGLFFMTGLLFQYLKGPRS
ncbi:MAG TPA: hypothetical protein VLE89_07715 [Chlamydiales bacterium]|nr:hypothetical protein [Chlamydiales bacterium]